MVNVPLIWQLLILELAIDGLRLGCTEYPEYAKYAVECDRRSRIGRILSDRPGGLTARVMLAHGICGSCELYAAEF